MKDNIINVVIALSIAAVTFGLALVNTVYLIGTL